MEGGSGSADGGEDLVGGLFPDEWFRVVVPVFDPGIEGVLKVFHGFERGVGESFSGEDGEPSIRRG